MINDNRQQYMVNIRDVVRVAVFACDAVEAVQKALAEKHGVRVEDVLAAPADVFTASPNSRWHFSVYGGGEYDVTPSRVAKRPKTAVALAEFVGAPILPFGEPV